MAGISHSLWAQSELRFEHLNKDEGLSQGTVNAILQDNAGLMWFGTNDGLNRYDGKNIIIYRRNHTDKKSLPNNNILCLAQDYKNRIWIGTMGGGLFFHDPVSNTFHSYKEIIDNPNQFDIGQKINCVVNDTANNVLWAGSNAGVIAIDFKTRKLTFIDFLINKVDGAIVGNISSILIEKNLAWIGTEKGGLLRLDKQTGQITSIPVADNRNFNDDADYHTVIMKTHRDKNGLLWVSSYGKGLLLLDELNLTLIEPGFKSEKNINVLSPWIHSMAMVGDTAIWCATSGDGLQIINLKTNKITIIQFDPAASHGITSNVLKSVYLDSNNGIWIGDNGLGLNYFFPVSKKIKNISYSSSASNLTFQSVRSIYRDENKNLWVGGYGGFNVFDSNFTRSIVSEKTENAYCIYPDKLAKNEIWIGSEGEGLMKFNKIDGRLLKQFPLKIFENGKGFISEHVYSILDKSENEIWVGTEHALNVFNKKSLTNKELKIEANGMIFNTKGCVRVIYKDSKNRIWIGTPGEGLALLHNDTLVSKIFKSNQENPSSISSNIIYSVYESDKGVIYIGTDNGLNIYNEDTGSFAHINTADGLVNDVVYGILEDGDNNIWLSTNEGISCFNPILRSFRNYNVEDGLQANEFNSGAYYKDDEGNLYFGGINGISVFQPKDLKENHFEPKIVFTQLTIGNRPATIDPPITYAHEVKLNYYNQAFRLEFAALNFYKPKKNQYAYRIKEISEKWIYIGNENKIEIANLGYGTFTIQVKASNNDGVWNDKGTYLTMIIDPPFWANIWFRILFILLVLAMVSIVFYRRIRNLNRYKRKLEMEVASQTRALKEVNVELMNEINVWKKTENELKIANQSKDLFFSIIAHDLKNPFNSILGITELLSEDFDNYDKTEQKQLIQLVGNSARNLFDLLENLLTWSLAQRGKLVFTPEIISLYKIVNETLSLHSQQAKQKNITLKSELTSSNLAYADENSIRTVMRNFVSNAIKFTPNGGTVTISAAYSNAMIIVYVIDTGIGMSNENIAKLFRVDVQFKTAGTSNENGTGLGLSICNEFIKANGGEIVVKSELGKGSAFSFSLQKAPESRSVD